MKKIILFIFLSFSLFGEENNSKVSFGTGIGQEYGVFGFQTSMEVFSGSRVFFSFFPIQPYIHTIGISSDLYFLKNTNFRTYLAYGTFVFSPLNNTTMNHMLSTSIGLDYYFSKPYQGWHLGVGTMIYSSQYTYDWKSFGFSDWHKYDSGYGTIPIVFSLGYKF